MWPDPLRVSVKGRNTGNEGRGGGGVFSEDSLLFGSPVRFFIFKEGKGQEGLRVQKRIKRSYTVQHSSSQCYYLDLGYTAN